MTAPPHDSSERLESSERLGAEERLRADLDLFRADVRPRIDPSLADRVLAAVAAGAHRASDEERFQVAARRWSAAAAVLVAVGVGGSLALDRVARPAEAGDSAALTSFVETNRFSLEVDLALDQRPVAPASGPSAPSNDPSDARPR
jgi:hypothetical protein